MEAEITLPAEVAVMTLPGVAFFPQALMPLHIFEPRYRAMLRDVLDGHRQFAVAGMDLDKAAVAFEPPCRVATIGVIRACQDREDGTSNLLLQGLCRVEVSDIIEEQPYRRVRIRPLASEPGGTEEENMRLRSRLSRLLGTRQRLSGEGSEQLAKFLRTIEDPEIYSDLAAFNLCEDAGFKQRLLETLSVRRRLQLLNQWAQREVDGLKLRAKLQGALGDDDIGNN